VPKYVIIRAVPSDGSLSAWVAIFARLTSTYSSGYDGWRYIGATPPATYTNTRHAKIDGTTLAWYNENPQAYGDKEQLNGANMPYYALAIG